MSGERSLSTPSASLVHPVSGGQFESGAVSDEREAVNGERMSDEIKR